MRKTPGLGLGTYLHGRENQQRMAEYKLAANERTWGQTYHSKSTPSTLANRTREWRIRATPPPWGVALKKAIFTRRFLRSLANLLTADQVAGPTVFS